RGGGESAEDGSPGEVGGSGACLAATSKPAGASPNGTASSWLSLETTRPWSWTMSQWPRRSGSAPPRLAGSNVWPMQSRLNGKVAVSGVIGPILWYRPRYGPAIHRTPAALHGRHWRGARGRPGSPGDHAERRYQPRFPPGLRLLLPHRVRRARPRRGLQPHARQGALRPVRAAARPRDGDLERLSRGDRRRGGALWRRRGLFDRRARSEAPRLRPGPPGPLLPARQSRLRRAHHAPGRRAASGPRAPLHAADASRGSVADPQRAAASQA